MPEFPPLPAVTERDVYITRSFAAPIQLVWDFWTKPELLAQWFGPHGISVHESTIAVDVREGGAWNLRMHDDNGVYPIEAEILIAAPPEYLELRLQANTAQGQVEDVLLRIQFHDHGDTTRMTLQQGPFDPEFRDLTRDGWIQSFEKLDAIVGAA
jgi:uncharacterized protein YndB with AHSA1/START domain